MRYLRCLPDRLLGERRAVEQFLQFLQAGSNLLQLQVLTSHTEYYLTYTKKPEM
jgi:hypothetical protein